MKRCCSLQQRGQFDTLRVTYFQRRPHSGNFSIERVFGDVRAAMPEHVESRVALCRFPSRGLGYRIYNAIEACFRQGDINHIAGDVHFLALLLDHDKTVLTIHDLASLHRLGGYRRALLLLLWYQLPVWRAARITVISESTKEDLLRYVRINPQKIRVIPNPVSNSFRPTLKRFSAEKPQILQVGTGPNKNLERLSMALHGVGCHLRIIGHLTDLQVELLRRHGVEYSSVENISDEEVVQEYCACDMLVFASTYEGFGLPIVEANASGRPVVTSNLYSMPEVAGNAAALVDPYDISSIRSGIIRVIQDAEYRAYLIQGGFENAKRFRPETIASEYVKIYHELSRTR